MRYLGDEVPVDVQEELELLRSKVAFLVTQRDQLRGELKAKQDLVKALYHKCSKLGYDYNKLLNTQPTMRPRGRAIKANNKKGKP